LDYWERQAWRHQESADRGELRQFYMARAGYDLCEGVGFWDHLSRSSDG